MRADIDSTTGMNGRVGGDELSEWLTSRGQLGPTACGLTACGLISSANDIQRQQVESPTSLWDQVPDGVVMRCSIVNCCRMIEGERERGSEGARERGSSAENALSPIFKGDKRYADKRFEAAQHTTFKRTAPRHPQWYPTQS